MSTSLALIAFGLVCGSGVAHAVTGKLDQALSAYDAAITSDPTAAVTKLTSPVTLDGTAGSPFDFGATLGDGTMEFILKGNPAAGPNAYLAVGESPTSSLRYAQWQNTLQVGFTQGGVADYMFTPAVASPTVPTHLTYVWNSAELTMSLYVNGVLAGTTTDVSPDFALPTGAGVLGATAGGAESMTGTIYRVTVYSGIVPEASIKTHADAFANVALPVVGAFTATPDEINPQGSSVLSWQVQNATTVYLNGAIVTGASQTVAPAVTTTYTLVASNEVATASGRVRVLVNPRLDLYDTTIAADGIAGLSPIAISTNTVNLTGAGGEPFDFGASSGNVTMEFILEGDPTAGPDGYLAVGEIALSSLRYAQWQNTRQMGFTQGGVADYMFVPGVPSPTIATHVAYVWSAETLTMKIYINGVLSGTIVNVNDAFVMPSGAGFLGATASGGEAMVGRIFRVVVYSGIVPEATVQKHATAFTSVLRPPIISSFTATPNEILGQGSATLNWLAQDAVAVFLNGVNVTGSTNQTVSPASTTTYTLIASNNVSTVSAQVRVLVTPLLTGYDAAIAADAINGLPPVATLTNAVTLTGSGGSPFDFGATSGDVTMEFILEGDPTAGPDGYLAVGEVASSNLRYAQWQNTRLMGFTRLGVADYLFTPPVPSPTVPTHVAYVWNSTDVTMTIYTNGVLAGTTTDVVDFVMPSGAGFLGSTAAGGEAMVGRIFRVVVYSGIVSEAAIQRHGSAFKGASGGLSLSVAEVGVSSVTLEWTGGTGPFLLQKKGSFNDAAWMNVLTTPNRTASVPRDGNAGFFRVMDNATNEVAPLTAFLGGAFENPAVTTAATGLGTFSIEGNKLSYDISYAGLSGPATAAHIHGNAATTNNAGVLIAFTPPAAASGRITGTATLTEAQRTNILAGRTYANIHTALNGGGEIRGQIAQINLKATLNGANEVPVVDTPATGSGTFTLVGNELWIDLSYTGLKGVANNSHIHGRADAMTSAGVLVPTNTLHEGPFGTAGHFKGKVVLSPANLAHLIDGTTYFNIHSAAHGGGEIRGQIVP